MAKIYTKKGDTGKTGLLGGTRKLKSDIKIESYGNVDELNCHIGVLRDQEGLQAMMDRFTQIQQSLFVIGSHLANDPEKSKFELPAFEEQDVKLLEQWIDEMDEQLEPMRFFILPGGHPSISAAHVARAVCRRAERSVVSLAQQEEVQSAIIQYLNRLSDYLFVLCRWLSKALDVKEIEWKP